MIIIKGVPVTLFENMKNSLDNQFNLIDPGNSIDSNKDLAPIDDMVPKDYQLSLWSLYLTRSILDTKLSRVSYRSLNAT